MTNNITLYGLLQYIKQNDINRYTELIRLKSTNPDKFRDKLNMEGYRLRKRQVYANYMNDPIDQTLLTNISEDEPLLDFFSKQSYMYYLDNYYGFDNLKHITEIYNDTINHNQDKIKLFFDKFSSYKGKITTKLFKSKKTLNIGFHIKHLKDTHIEKVVYFDTKINKKEWLVLNTLTAEMWVYEFVTQTKRFILYSESELNLTNCVIEGTEILLTDRNQIGEELKIDSFETIFIVSKQHTAAPQFDDPKALMEMCKEKELIGDNLFSYIFSDISIYYDHPTYFKYLIGAWMFNNKYQGKPLNLQIIAIPGTGKSTLETCIWEKYDETQQIVEGTSSTIKALIPSWKNNPPKPGALLEANRICVIDEIGRILDNVPQERADREFARMNSILEHQKNRMLGSGNGEFEFNATARVLTVGNPINNAKDIRQMVKRIDSSFLSRFLIWFQDDKHIEMISTRKSMRPVIHNPEMLDTDFFMGVVDYLTSVQSEYDDDLVKDIYIASERYFVQETMDELTDMVYKQIYKSRYQDHIRNLMDGIIKTRCLIENNSNLKAKKEDYVMLKTIWDLMIVNWGLYLNSQSLISMIDPGKIEEEDMR